MRLHVEVSRDTGEQRIGIIVTLLNRASLKADGLAETVAAAVAADVPVFLEIPGPRGYTAGLARVNAALADAVQARDKPALLYILRRARAMGRYGDHRLITFPDSP